MSTFSNVIVSKDGKSYLKNANANTTVADISVSSKTAASPDFKVGDKYLIKSLSGNLDTYGRFLSQKDPDGSESEHEFKYEFENVE